MKVFVHNLAGGELHSLCIDASASVADLLKTLRDSDPIFSSASLRFAGDQGSIWNESSTMKVSALGLEDGSILTLMMHKLHLCATQPDDTHPADTIQVWNSNSGECICTLTDQCWHAHFSAGGSRILLECDEFQICSSTSGVHICT